MNHRHSGPKVRYRTSRGRIRYRERPIHKWISNKDSKYLRKLNKYKIKIKDLDDFGGMNYYAAKELNFKPVPQKNEIFIESDKPKFMESTLIHEITEAELMKKGMNYLPAHKKAIGAEIEAGLVSKKELFRNNKDLFEQLKERGIRRHRAIRRYDPREQERHLDTIQQLKREIMPLQENLNELSKNVDLTEEQIEVENAIFDKQKAIQEEQSFLE